MITCHSRAKIRLLIYYIIYIEREWEIKYITWMCGYNKHQSWFRIDRLKTTSVLALVVVLSFLFIPFHSVLWRYVLFHSAHYCPKAVKLFAIHLHGCLTFSTQITNSYTHTGIERVFGESTNTPESCIVNAQLFCLGFCEAGSSCILLYWSYNLLVYTIRIRNVNEKVYCTALNDQLCWFANLFCCFTF